MSLWNFTIDDASPYLSYSPHGDSLAQSQTSIGWQTWYTESHDNTAPNEVGRGDSYHVTSSRNANVTVRFRGTGIAFYGFSNSSFDVIIDSDSPATVDGLFLSDSLLYSTYNLTDGLHSVTLSSNPLNATQILAFDSAITSIPLSSDESPPSPIFYDNSDTTSLTYVGSWATETQPGVPNTTVTAAFRQTNETGASIFFSFSEANAIVVKGLLGVNNGLYSVSLDNATTIFNGTSLWLLPDALLYFEAGLDPSIAHQLNITNLNGSLSFNSITVFKHEPKTATTQGIPSSKAHTSLNKLPTILGSVLGCIALLIIILGTFIFYRRRCHPRSNNSFKLQDLPPPSLFTHFPSKFKPESELVEPVTSPMLATLFQGAPDERNRSIHNTLSHQDDNSTVTTSDVNSATNLLRKPSNRSITSSASSLPPPTNRSRSNARAVAEPVPSSSSTFNSNGHATHFHFDSTPTPQYSLKPARKPLPVIPAPSYSPSPRLSEPTISTIHEASLGDPELPGYAPPEYER